MSWKYIVIRTGPFDLPVIFPATLSHESIAKTLLPAIPTYPGSVPRILSAGFIDDVAAIDISGQSESLGIKSRPREDEVLINDFIEHHGVAKI